MKWGIFFRKNIYGILVFALLLVSIFWGITFRAGLKDCGISSISSQKDIREGMVSVAGLWGGDGIEEISMDSFSTEPDSYGVEEAEVIAVATSTGNLFQTEGSIGQEIIIEEVIRGQELAEVGKPGYVYQYFGFQEVDGSILYGNALNLMKPGERYLIFMMRSPLSDYEKMSQYVLASDYFGYVKIDGEETATLQEGLDHYDFSALSDYEFFSVSEQVTKVLNDIRKELLMKYYPVSSCSVGNE